MKPKKAKVEKVFPQTWHRVDRLALVETRSLTPAPPEPIETVVVLAEQAKTIEPELTDTKGIVFKGLPVEKVSTATAYFPTETEALEFAYSDLFRRETELKQAVETRSSRRLEILKKLK